MLPTKDGPALNMNPFQYWPPRNVGGGIPIEPKVIIAEISETTKCQKTTVVGVKSTGQELNNLSLNPVT